MLKTPIVSCSLCLLVFSYCVPTSAAPPVEHQGVLPLDAQGKPLNLDLETGTLQDWKVEGAAFQDQPIKGDAVRARRADMRSNHTGQFWIGSYERDGDKPQGTLTSTAFKVTQPFATFLVAGGGHATTCVEIVREDSQQVIFTAFGHETESLEPVLVDLQKHQGQKIFIRIVDKHSGGWGHINYDDFRFHAARPEFPVRAKPSAPDKIANAGLSPDEAAKAMTVPDGFSVTLFAGEPDVKQPVAFCIDDRGRLWVAEAYSYPVRVPEKDAKDRILIFEDTDGDGRFDTRKIFIEKLNLVSGIEKGFGGVYVGAAPHFLFIPDRNHDDQPDGPPEILLDGWGSQDSHETLNSFIWGPDGWLYGCHGVFTYSNVGKPATPDDKRIPINAGIWRYHPTRHEFEVFAHGTSNPWGVDFNDHGQAFLTACVIPHLFQVIQGGRYQRQAGQHYNPYTYDDIKTIAVHRHWIGDTPHSGNNRSDAAGGGHAHAGAMVYLGGAWPKEYRNQIFMNNIHGARINMDLLTPKGSGYEGNRGPDFLFAHDAWSQILYLQYGPDGQVYMIDWYDKNQCHHREINNHDRTNGRIFKVSSKRAADSKPSPQPMPDLNKLSDDDLVQLQLNSNDWHVRHARRILQERAAKQPLAKSALASLEKIAFEHADETRRLRALWCLHVTAGLNDTQIMQGLSNSSPLVRAWSVQLALENRSQPDTTLMHKLQELAAADSSPVVRLYLASVLQRMRWNDRIDILMNLVQHTEDAQDHNLPLMYWYAAEPFANADLQAAVLIADRAKSVPLVRQFMVRRLAQLGTPDALSMLIGGTLTKTESVADQRSVLREISAGLKGHRQVPMPQNWPEIYTRLSISNDPDIRSLSTSLALTFGDTSARTALRQVIVDAKAALAVRQNALAALLNANDAGLAPTLQQLVSDASLRSAALRGLAAYDDPKTPETLLSIYNQCTSAEKRDALNTLASRAPYAQALLAAVDHKKIPATDLSADLIRQLTNLKDPKLNAEIQRVWGTVRDTPADRIKLIADYKKMLGAPAKTPPELPLGRALYAKTCQQCHTLFGIGGKVGPELTGSNRANLDYILSNVLDPSALIGKDYQAQIITTSNGRILTGIVREENQDSLTLVTANETLTLPKGEIDARELSPKSMMPDDQWKPFSEHEVRSLVAYLASPSQTSLLGTADNLASFFNGRDLTGWQGDPKLWSVEQGEIVGKTAGLSRNEFLTSDLLLGDFRLSMQVKLVDNAGNSGVQFRSQALPDGSVKGYQADVGVGWWGKLYEEHGRGLLWPKSGEEHLKPGEWNLYEIVAQGSHIRTFLNGKPCVDLDDPSGARRGIVAFQLHSGGATEVRYKDLKIELGK
jgi:putative membrane-bound dehydrogenase-like protein